MYETIRITEFYAGPERPYRAGRNVLWYDTATGRTAVKWRGTWFYDFEVPISATPVNTGGFSGGFDDGFDIG